MNTSRFHLIVTLTCLCCLPAIARDWYLSAGGNGDGLTAGSPTQNLAAVLTYAARNDALYLNGGDGFGYAPNVLTAAVKLTMQSYGTGQAIISNTTALAGQLLTLAMPASGSTFDNLLFGFKDLGTSVNPYRTLYLDNNTSNITIRSCMFQHMDSPGGDYRGNPFIAMHQSAHPYVVISNNYLCDLRYGSGIQYRNHMIAVRDADDLIVANNVVSNYEGFLSFSEPMSARVQVLSNKLYRCWGDINWPNVGSATAGGLVKNSYNGLYAGDFAFNIIYSGFPDMTNVTRYAAFSIDRGFNNGRIYNNTFVGLGAAWLLASGAEIVTNLQWYNNIMVAFDNGQARTGFYSVVNGMKNGMVYTNIWDPFHVFTNEFFATNTMSIAGNPLVDPLFASVDVGSPSFLRPAAPEVAYAYGGGYIGAVYPVPEPWCAGLLAGVLLFRRRR